MLNESSKIGYVVKRYPRFSETFVVNEILAHETAGQSLEIFSLRPPADTHFQDLISRVRSPLTYLSCGRVQSNELWEAIVNCNQVLPGTIQRLEEAANEPALDVFCGVQLAVQAVRKGITHLHAHFATSSASVARIASKLTGIPYSMTAHAKDIFHESVSPEDLGRKIHDSAWTLTVSDFNLNYLQQMFPESTSRIVRLYNGLNLSDFPFHSPLQRPPRIVAVGRFVEKKGFNDLISACGLLRDQGVSFECMLVGGGELETSLASQIAVQRLSDHIRMLGPCPQREVKELIRTSAVMAAPCIQGEDGNRDGLPTVLLESMALGTPCVSTDVTGIPEVIRNRETGLMVRQKSPAELADAIQQLLYRSDLRVYLATAARSLIEQEFDVQRISSQQRHYFSTSNLSSQQKNLPRNTLSESWSISEPVTSRTH
ncbi:MAG: glycosyltransferase family 4 protein [Planctomyces sp.]|nr:glycosyltransferase family 4 protein [Planctomyces sp.]